MTSKVNKKRCLTPLIPRKDARIGSKVVIPRKDARIGSKVVVFQSTASTNDIAWEYASNADNDGLCVLTESQTKGRGRRGRMWFSEPGQSILCSVLLTKTNIEAELLTLAAAVATAEAISAFCNLPCRIKWPNDILIRNQKAAGILVEKRNIKSKPCFVVGIGINCNQTRETFQEYNLNLPATSLAIEGSQGIDRTGLICELLAKLEEWLDKANRPSSINNRQSPVVDRWLELSGMLGRHITLECDGQRFSGFCRGVDPVEGLIVHLDNSLVRMFGAAQTSIAYD
ncbi:MAG: biotin--[acetyl-CoA-carboxylase] ligase [Phycisphaerae bacterium]|nr:biotin--[acetyl-CoA-carboxylase] ligase [Phycisphaerae bacterium]